MAQIISDWENLSPEDQKTYLHRARYLLYWGYLGGEDDESLAKIIYDKEKKNESI